MSDTTTITLPLSPDTVAVLGLLLLLILGSYLVFRAMPSDAAKPKTLLQRFEETWGFRLKDPLAAAFLVAVFFAYAMIFAFALLISLRLLAQLFFGLDLALPGVPTPNAVADNPANPNLPFGLAALLAAVLGAPFIIWRSLVAAKQAAIAEEALFNDKINAAATDLAARREVTSRITQDGKETILTEWQDDLVTRAAAIDRLEGLAKERPDIAPRIARMLSIYVQELTREHPAQNPPEGATAEELRDWVATLSQRKRPDMERAVQSLGRINPKNDAARITFEPKNIDLSRCNLQGMELRGANLAGARLQDSHLQAADLSFANLSDAQLSRADAYGASFKQAKLSRARLGRANLSKANFSGVEMHNANLGRSQLYETRFRGAQMQDSRLRKAHMQYADLSEAQMQRADLSGADLKCASFEGAALQEANLETAKMQAANLRKTQMQKANLVWAQLQGAVLVNANLKGGTLVDADLDGAFLCSVQMSEETTTVASRFSGTAVVKCDELMLINLRTSWEDVIAFLDVLPKDAPDHWVQIAGHDWNEKRILAQWRAWSATLDPPVTIAPDFNPD